MKYLLVLLVLVVAVGIWRGKRRAQTAAQLQPPQTMVACCHCGLHLPRAEAVTNGAGQTFCSAEHRRLAPQSPDHN